MSHQEDDLPVLNAVVETGNASIIQSTRMGNEVLRELENLRQDAARAMPISRDDHDEQSAPSAETATESDTLPAASDDAGDIPAVEIPEGFDFASVASGTVANTHSLSELDTQYPDQTANEPLATPLTGMSFVLTDDEINLLIDDIVDRHVSALRRDIKRLLERARRSP